jgi:cytochrome P450
VANSLKLTGDVIVVDENSRAADPYPFYALLRTQRPVARVEIPPAPPLWLVTRHEDVKAALADPRLRKDSAGVATALRRAAGIPDEVPSTDLGLHDHMLNSDPPTHTRLRKLVGKAFTGRAVDRLRPRIEAVAAELAEAMAARLAAGEPSVDLVEDYALALPMTVICEILDVPEARRREFGHWSHTILAGGSVAASSAASAAMHQYLSELVADKRANPGPDILSAILAPDEEADRLTQAEATAMASLLLIAGHETTVNLIGSGVLALLRNPEQLARLRADPTLLSGAVEEFLRLDSPVDLATFRYTSEELSIGGVTIAAGQLVLLGLGSANRDPEVFERPDELDITRARGGSLAFGHGIHHCLGAALARIEGEIAFRVLLDRFPTLALAADAHELRWHKSLLFRGLAALPVRAG